MGINVVLNVLNDDAVQVDNSMLVVVLVPVELVALHDNYPVKWHIYFYSLVPLAVLAYCQFPILKL